jgi:hypothetical protein
VVSGSRAPFFNSEATGIPKPFLKTDLGKYRWSLV